MALLHRKEHGTYIEPEEYQLEYNSQRWGEALFNDNEHLMKFLETPNFGSIYIRRYYTPIAQQFHQTMRNTSMLIKSTSLDTLMWALDL